MTPLERHMYRDIRALMSTDGRGYMPEPEQEYTFADGNDGRPHDPVTGKARRWRFDFAWPEYHLAVECDGGQWVRGRHNRGEGLANDHEKRNAAQILGWRVLSFATSQIESGEAFDTLAVVWPPF